MDLRRTRSRLRARVHDLSVSWHPINLSRRFWLLCCRLKGIEVVPTDRSPRGPGPGEPDFLIYRKGTVIGSLARRSYRNPDLPDDGAWWIVSPKALRRGGFGRPERAAMTLARVSRLPHRTRGRLVATGTQPTDAPLPRPGRSL